MSFVYWVYDRTCDSTDDGWIGVSEQPETRPAQVRRALGCKNKVYMLLLFEGTRKACLRRERWYRPRPNMGWNTLGGGIAAAPIKHGLAPRPGLFGVRPPIFSQRELARLWR
jgi:hypothetical protein